MIADRGDEGGIFLLGAGFVVAGECFGGGVLDAQLIGDLLMGCCTSTRLACSCMTFWKKKSLVLRGILWYLFLFFLVVFSFNLAVSPPSCMIQSLQIKLNITGIKPCKYL